ncbi:MAG: SRPBCC family protein [Verrucomicrobiota bacterium]
MPQTIQLHRVFRCPPARLFKAFSNPIALVKWVPPFGFTCTVHEFDFRVGGKFRMSFTNHTNDRSHGFGGEYLEILPNEFIRYTDVFDDPNLPGTMICTVELKEVFCGTELRVTQENVPDLIPAEMCYLGWQESLIQLGQLAEPEILE